MTDLVVAIFLAALFVIGIVSAIQMLPSSQQGGQFCESAEEKQHDAPSADPGTLACS